jgi:hypothetical protein
MSAIPSRAVATRADSGCAPDGTARARRRLRWALLRVAALLCLLSAAAVYEAVHLSAFFDDNIWWHVRTGVWILSHHAVPRSGLFSQLADARWIDSSWGFDLLAGLAYQALGLRAIPALLMSLKVALAAVTFYLALGWRRRFWTAVALSAAAQFAMLGLLPGPLWFSAIFFGIELALLLQCRRSGSLRPLLFLPPMFLLWANLHIEFVEGLLLLGLFVLTVCVEHPLRGAGISWLESRPVSPAKTAAVAVLSLLATLLTPYSVHLLGQFFRVSYSGAGFRHFLEMQAMNFRQPQHYLLLVMIMGAFFALGRRRSRDLFKLALLIACSLVAFRIQRDMWLAAFAALAVLADAHGAAASGAEQDRAAFRWEHPVGAALALGILAVSVAFVPGRKQDVMQKVNDTYPVKACDFIRANHLAGPLFNAYSWGGFLTWYLPEYPVVIDGRAGLYGDKLITRHYNTVSGNQLLELNPSFAQAGTFLLERHSGIARALTTIPMLAAQYRVLYSDNVAIVLQRK